MESLILYTILFTLPGNSPGSNMYISMFLVWLEMLLRKGGLDKGDTVIVLLDEPSANALQEYDILSHLIDSAPFTIDFKIVEQPKTLNEGFKLKYIIPAYLNCAPDTIVCYMDIDNIPLAPLKPGFFETLKGSAQVGISLEGNSSDDFYLGKLRGQMGLTCEDLQKTAGITAGFFLFKVNPVNISLLNGLKRRIESSTYDDIADQAYFNEMIWRLREANYPIGEYPEDLIEMSLAQVTPKTAILNLCGEPGDGGHHWQRILTAYIYYNMKS